MNNPSAAHDSELLPIEKKIQRLDICNKLCQLDRHSHSDSRLPIGSRKFQHGPTISATFIPRGSYQYGQSDSKFSSISITASLSHQFKWPMDSYGCKIEVTVCVYEYGKTEEIKEKTKKIKLSEGEDSKTLIIDKVVPFDSIAYDTDARYLKFVVEAKLWWDKIPEQQEVDDSEFVLV